LVSEKLGADEMYDVQLLDSCVHLSLTLTLKVVLDTRGGDRLGEGVDATLDEPRDEDVGPLGAVLLGDVEDDGVVAESLAVGTAEGRVALGKDVLLLEPGDELGLGALDRELDLVGDGTDADVLEELAATVDVKVGNTNRLYEALVNELLHLAPRGENVLRERDVETLLALGRHLDVLPLGKDTGGGLNIEADLRCE
jgi:hypothetical protein